MERPDVLFCATVAAICRPGVNFTDILLAAFAAKSFRQKITNSNRKHIKGAKNFRMKNLLIKYW
jgi:hypothetical protein